MLSDTMMLGGGRKAAYSIENSLLFRGEQYLSRTPIVQGDSKTWTFSAWVRRSALNDVTCVLLADSTGVDGLRYSTAGDSGDNISFGCNSTYVFTTAPVYRDPTGWHHVVFVFDSDNPTASDRLICYVNGVRQATTLNSLGQGAVSRFNNPAYEMRLGRWTGSTSFSGYIAEVAFVDGAALAPSSFGEVDSVTGSWRPKVPIVPDYGTNGFNLGKPWSVGNLGADYSGRGNDWTPVGFAEADVVKDTPSNVYATLNPLDISGGTLAGGALQYTGVSYNSFGQVRASLPMVDGAYFEFKLGAGLNGSSPIDEFVGVGVAGAPLLTGSLGVLGFSPGQAGFRLYNGATMVNGVAGAAYETPRLVAGDYGCVFYRNGSLWVGRISAGTITWMNGGNPDAGTGAIFENLNGTYYPAIANTTATILEVNFGQYAFQATVLPRGARPLSTAGLPATSGQASGSFTGNANAAGPCVYTGAVPLTLTINGNPVTWGTHADKLATGFKIRTASASYNKSGANTWSATYDRKPTVGPKGRAPANAQAN